MLWLLQCSPTPVRLRWGWWPVFLQHCSVMPRVSIIMILFYKYLWWSGEPKPVVTWRRADGESINLQHRGGQTMVQGPVLQLGDLRPRDAGVYMCVAKNGNPPAIVQNIKLNVMCKIILWQIYAMHEGTCLQIYFYLNILVGPEVSAMRPELHVPAGVSTRLGCSVSGYPQPQVIWLKDDKCKRWWFDTDLKILCFRHNIWQCIQCYKLSGDKSNDANNSRNKSGETQIDSESG